MKQLKNFNYSSNDVSDEELLDSVMGKYKNKDEEQLTQELIKAAKAAKEDGSFSEESLQNFFDLVSPNLNEMQRQKLSNLIEVIKLENT